MVWWKVKWFGQGLVEVRVEVGMALLGCGCSLVEIGIIQLESG